MATRKKPRNQLVPFPLRQLLDLKGWSQRKLARSCGIHERRISDLCHGRHSPSWRTILRICTTLGVDLGELRPGPGVQT